MVTWLIRKRGVGKMSKCSWALSSKKYEDYHDFEWGIPTHDEHRLFEMLILEGQQAGLSWITILNKRELLNEAYYNFDPYKLARLTENDIEKYLNDSRVIKNRLKIEAVINNAKCYLKLKEKYESLDKFLWSYVDFKPIDNQLKSLSEAPTKTALSEKISQDLKALGFKFVGPTIIYSYLQAIGIVNDHLISCPFHEHK